MTDDLETLRPEVQQALAWLKSGVRPGTRSFDGWSIIRAELLRLAQYEQAAGRLAIEKAEFRQRAERAEAELAALKARVAEAVIGKPIECDFENMTVTLQVDASFSTNGKPFRLVVEE